MTARRSKPNATAVAIAVVALLVVVAGGLHLSSTRSTSAHSAFRAAPEVKPDADKATTWKADKWRSGRALDLPTRRELEATYVNAWQAIDRYAIEGSEGAVDAAFVGPASGAIKATSKAGSASVKSLGHKLELRFLSTTATVAAVRDERAHLVREIRTGDGVMTVESIEQFDLLFTLEQGSWKIRQMRRTGGDEVKVTMRGASGSNKVLLPTKAQP